MYIYNFATRRPLRAPYVQYREADLTGVGNDCYFSGK